MKNYLRILGAVSIWAIINGLVIKGVHASPTAIGFWMGFVGALLCLVVFIFNNFKSFRELNKSSCLLLILLGAAAGVNNVFFYVAIKMNEVANVALIHYVAQPIAVFWLVWLLKEKLTKQHIAAMVLGFIGLTVLVWKNGGITFELWLLFALFSAFFYSWEIFFSRKLGVENIDPMLSASSKLIFQMMAMSVGAVIFSQSLAVSHTSLWQLLVAGALLFVSFVWVFRGLMTVSGRDFSIMGYVDRLGAVLIGILVFGESLTWQKLVGGGLILLAQAIVLFARTKSKNNAPN